MTCSQRPFVHVDEYLRLPGEQLRERCCLGARRRWRRLDAFGRPESRPCCPGNLFAVQGSAPWRCTAARECAAAMGVDVGHMEYERLAQAIPPAYSQLVFSQMCMRIAEARFGAPAITYDEMVARPAQARRRRLMAHWLRGAGDRPRTQPKAQRTASTTRRVPHGAVGQVGVVVHGDRLRGLRIAV